MYCRHLTTAELRNLASIDPLSAAGEVLRRFVNGDFVSVSELDEAVGEVADEAEALREEFERVNRVLLAIQQAANGV